MLDLANTRCYANGCVIFDKETNEYFTEYQFANDYNTSVSLEAAKLFNSGMDAKTVLTNLPDKAKNFLILPCATREYDDGKTVVKARFLPYSLAGRLGQEAEMDSYLNNFSPSHRNIASLYCTAAQSIASINDGAHRRDMVEKLEKIKTIITGHDEPDPGTIVAIMGVFLLTSQVDERLIKDLLPNRSVTYLKTCLDRARESIAWHN